jgi:hypothetical protein
MTHSQSFHGVRLRPQTCLESSTRPAKAYGSIIVQTLPLYDSGFVSICSNP